MKRWNSYSVDLGEVDEMLNALTQNGMVVFSATPYTEIWTERGADQRPEVRSRTSVLVVAWEEVGQA